MTSSSKDYLNRMGVASPPPSTYAFDPGYSSSTVQAHLFQSGHLLCGVKLSMATWQVAAGAAVAEKIASIHGAGLPVIAGGGAFEISSFYDVISDYFALCASTGFDWVEVGEGFAASIDSPAALVGLAGQFGLRLQYELGSKFRGPIEGSIVACSQIKEWLSAGANQIVVEAREDAVGVGLFDGHGVLNYRLADDLLRSVEHDFRLLQFEAPTKKSQFALMEHFGPEVVLGNVRLEEILRVEVFRRGLHPQAFQCATLRPHGSEQ
jgi:phosphosulfolactate synthase